MGMKKAILSLSIIAILTLCLPNVTTASTSNPATAPHSKIVTDVKGQQPTTLTFTVDAQATVNTWYNYSGSLTAGGTGVSGAVIHLQQKWHNITWMTIFNDTTDSNGNFAGQIISYSTGDRDHRVTYDGYGQYAPSISNEVHTTISESVTGFLHV